MFSGVIVPHNGMEPFVKSAPGGAPAIEIPTSIVRRRAVKIGKNNVLTFYRHPGLSIQNRFPQSRTATPKGGRCRVLIECV
jgi:hypothetical protein